MIVLIRKLDIKLIFNLFEIFWNIWPFQDFKNILRHFSSFIKRWLFYTCYNISLYIYFIVIVLMLVFKLVHCYFIRLLDFFLLCFPNYFFRFCKLCGKTWYHLIYHLNRYFWYFWTFNKNSICFLCIFGPLALTFVFQC